MAEPALPVWAREKEEKKLFAAAVGYEAPASVLSEKEMTEEFVNVKRGAGSAALPAPAPTEYIIVFRLHPHWLGVVRPSSKAHSFAHKPTHDEILATIHTMFNISEVFPHYELRGVYKQSDEFTLMKGAFIIVDGMTINIIPRFATVKFHIVTWSVEYNRSECRKLMKEHNVCGSLTRDNVDSILVVMEHPDIDVLDAVFKQIEAVVSTAHKGYCHEPQWTYGWGSLESNVKTHKGTAKRDDGVRSWEDEDAQSASTYFNTPLTDEDVLLSLI